MPVVSTYASASVRGFSSKSISTAITYWLDAISLKSSTGGMYTDITSIDSTPWLFGYSGPLTGPSAKPFAMSLVQSTGAIDSYTILATRVPGDDYIRIRGVNKDTSGNLHILVARFFSATNGFLLIKYDSAGTLVYNKVFSGTSTNIGAALGDLIKDSSDYLYVFSFNSTSFVLTKIDPTNYTVVWSKTISMTVNITTSASSRPKCLYIDSSDNIYVVVYTTTGTVSTIFKFDTSGTILWQKSSANFSGGLSRKIDFDSSGNLYLLTNTTSTPTIVKLDSSGSTTYTKTYINSPGDIFLALIINTDDNIVILSRSSTSSSQFFTQSHDFVTGDMLYNTRINNTVSMIATDLISITGSLYVTCNLGALTGGNTNFNIKVNNNNSITSYSTPWSYSYTKDGGTVVNESGTLTSTGLANKTMSNTTVSFTTTSYTTSDFAITVADLAQTLGATVPFEYYTPLI